MCAVGPVLWSQATPVSLLSHCARDHVLSIVLWALGSQTVLWHSALDCTRRRAFSVLSSLCYCTALSTVLSTPCSTSVLSHCARHCALTLCSHTVLSHCVLWCSALDCDRRCALKYALWHSVPCLSTPLCSLPAALTQSPTHSFVSCTCPAAAAVSANGSVRHASVSVRHAFIQWGSPGLRSSYLGLKMWSCRGAATACQYSCMVAPIWCSH